MSKDLLRVTTQKIPSSRLAVELNVPANRCKASYEDALTRLSRSVKIPGFRKGKVPKAVILQRIGINQIFATALETLVDRVWKEAIEKESIEPLCQPELKGGFEELLQSFNPEKPLNLVLETDIAPTPKLKNKTGLTAEAETITFDPKSIDELIEQSQKQLAALIPVNDRPVKIGDIAVISFLGKYSDTEEEILGGSAESMDIDVEKGKMIPGFIEGLIGMKVSDQKTIACQFPDDYQEETSRGRKASFLVTLKDLKERELPELNDAFAQQTSDQKNMQDLRNQIELKLKDDLDLRNQNNKNEAILSCIEKELEVDIPKTLIDQEVINIVEQTAQNLSQQGIDVKSVFTNDLVKSLMDSSREKAETNLRRSLALEALAKEENISVQEKELEEKFESLKKELSKEKKIDEEKLRQAISSSILEEKLLKWLEENNTIIEKKSLEKSKMQSSEKGSSSKNKQPKTKKSNSK